MKHLHFVFNVFASDDRCITAVSSPVLASETAIIMQDKPN